MTDVWISNERHYCKYCNVWTSGDKGSINHHESGWKHKTSVKNYLRNQQRTHFKEQKEEQAIQKEIEKIQRAANISYQNDLLRADNIYTNNGIHTNNIQRPSNTLYKPQNNIQNNISNSTVLQEYPTPVSYERKITMEQVKIEEFYKSKGITGKPDIPIEPPPSFVPLPSSLSDISQNIIPPPIPPPIISSSSSKNEDSNDSNNTEESITTPILGSGFKEFYKQYYENLKQTDKKENIIEEEDNEQPYGEWVDVDKEEEKAKNAPITLIEDNFTKNNKTPSYYEKHIKPVFEDSDDEIDKELINLENKDSSKKSIYGSDDSEEEIDITKPVIFRKRKRKGKNLKGNAKKRRVISKISED